MSKKFLIRKSPFNEWWVLKRGVKNSQIVVGKFPLKKNARLFRNILEKNEPVVIKRCGKNCSCWPWCSL